MFDCSNIQKFYKSLKLPPCNKVKCKIESKYKVYYTFKRTVHEVGGGETIKFSVIAIIEFSWASCSLFLFIIQVPLLSAVFTLT